MEVAFSSLVFRLVSIDLKLPLAAGATPDQFLVCKLRQARRRGAATSCDREWRGSNAADKLAPCNESYRSMSRFILIPPIKQKNGTVPFLQPNTKMESSHSENLEGNHSLPLALQPNTILVPHSFHDIQSVLLIGIF